MTTLLRLLDELVLSFGGGGVLVMAFIIRTVERAK
jgi:hypothetical protein